MESKDIYEKGWMIEKKYGGGTIYWWNGKPKREGLGSWETDSLKGIRFARKEDAEICAIAQGYSLGIVYATEHVWQSDSQKTYCPDCGGDGWNMNGDIKEPCNRCEGTGEVGII